jgi:chemotaxis protein methyltransferase CheR
MNRSSRLISSLVDPTRIWFSHMDLKNLAELTRSRSGIAFERDKFAWLGQVAADFMVQQKIETTDEFLGVIEKQPQIFQKFINAITINESFLFRDRTLLASFVKNLLVPRFQSGDRVTLWSAACSTGDEPVTLGILCAEAEEVIRTSWQVYASDIDTDAIEKAKLAKFDRRKVKDLPTSLLDKYFDVVANGWQATCSIKDRIQYFHCNLASFDEPALPGQVDFVFLRNVMIYFDEETRHHAISKAAAALVDGGVLCLGHAETLGRDHPLFEQVVLDQVVFYRRRQR